MAWQMNNRNIWAAVALIAIIVPYAIFMFPFPTESIFSHIEDPEIRKNAVIINMRAWIWAFTIVLLCFIAAILSVRSNQKWRYFAGVGAVIVIVFQNFPFTLTESLFREVNTFSQFVNRVSFFMDFPILFQGIILFDITTPLLSCVVIYLVIVETLENRKTKPSNKQLHQDRAKSARPMS